MAVFEEALANGVAEEIRKGSVYYEAIKIVFTKRNIPRDEWSAFSKKVGKLLNFRATARKKTIKKRKEKKGYQGELF